MAARVLQPPGLDVPGGRGVRLQGERLVEAGKRLFRAGEMAQAHALLAPGRGVLRVVAEGLGVADEGLLGSAQALEHASLVAPGRGLAAPEGDRAVAARRRLPEPLHGAQAPALRYPIPRRQGPAPRR